MSTGNGERGADLFVMFVNKPNKVWLSEIGGDVGGKRPEGSWPVASSCRGGREE